NVEQSQQVSKGQSLLNIDPGEIIAQARAFEYQKVQSEKLELSLRAQLEEAQKTYDRYSSLLKEGAITQQEFDQIKSRLESIKAQVEQSRAMQESARSQKMAVESNLSYTNLSSPISGVVVSKNVDAGDMAMPGQVLMVIESGPYMFETYLPESLYGKLKIEQDYQIKIPSLNKDLRAKIVEISAHIDPVSKTFKVKLKPQEQEGLKSGMYAKLLIPSEKTQVAIPLAAVVKKFDFDAVWVLKEDKTLELRVVRLGELEGDMVLVQSGLKAGEIVVTSGKEKACQGCKVRE
ncbi:MAG: efflux RND transporter periplasmic adaptor subunit, partial [Aquificaceae bacterium]